MNRMDDRYITTKEAAEMLGVSDQRVRDLLKAGRLSGKKLGSRLGGMWLVERRSVETFERRGAGRPRKGTKYT
jgi:excisionase family DNA binding protein